MRSLPVIYKNQNNWYQKFWGERILCFLLTRYIHTQTLIHIWNAEHTALLEMVWNSVRFPQLGSRVSDGEKVYGAWEHASEKPRNVNKFEIKGKNEVPDVPTLSNLLQKCYSTSYQVNMKQDCACKSCFYIFAISFYLSALNQGKIVVEAHKNYRNTKYKEESLSSTSFLRKFGHAWACCDQYHHNMINFEVAKPQKFL